MNVVLLAVLFIAVQASAPHTMLANIQVATVTTPEASIITATAPIPTKVGTAIGAVEELGPVITAESAVVIDVASGTVLWGKRPYAVRSLASITKLLTAFTAVRQRPRWDESVLIETADVPADPTERHTVLAVGDRVIVGDLLTAALVRSDNVAANALARHLEALEGWFLAEMRSTASSLGVPSPHIVDPAGLSPENRGTAIDVVRLLAAAMREDEIARRLRMPNATITVQRPKKTSGFFSVRIPIQATNLLLGDGIPHAFRIAGGKTGYLDESGYNLALAVERDGHKVVIVVLGSASHDDRFRDTRLLADWTFRNYVWDSSTSSSASATSGSPR